MAVICGLGQVSTIKTPAVEVAVWRNKYLSLKYSFILNPQRDKLLGLALEDFRELK